MAQLNEVIIGSRAGVQRRMSAGELVAVGRHQLIESGAEALCDRTVLSRPAELRVRRIWPGTALMSAMPVCGSLPRNLTNSTR